MKGSVVPQTSSLTSSSFFYPLSFLLFLLLCFLFRPSAFSFLFFFPFSFFFPLSSFFFFLFLRHCFIILQFLCDHVLRWEATKQLRHNQSLMSRYISQIKVTFVNVADGKVLHRRSYLLQPIIKGKFPLELPLLPERSIFPPTSFSLDYWTLEEKLSWWNLVPSFHSWLLLLSNRVFNLLHTIRKRLHIFSKNKKKASFLIR